MFGITCADYEKMKTDLPKWPSEKAKEISKRFISNFSEENHLPNWVSSKDDFKTIIEKNREIFLQIFNQETAQKLKELNLDQSREVESIYLVGRGKHHTVWGHKDFPGLVFKLMRSEDAKKQTTVAQVALKVVEETKNCFLQIPCSTWIETEAKTTIYIEEHLPLAGLSMDEHREFWARVLIHYQSSESTQSYKTNLETLIGHIKLLIEKVGFWDVGCHNLPEVRLDGMGVCGTDFENVELDGKYVNIGLENLIRLVPVHPLVDGVIKSYEGIIPKILEQKKLQYNDWVRYVPDLKRPTAERIRDEFEVDFAEEIEELESRQLALQYYDEKGYQCGDELINPCDISSLKDPEKILAEQLIKTIQSFQLKNKDNRTPLLSKRWVCIQPGSPYNEFNMKKQYSYDRFVKVLNFFKDKELIVSWTDTHKSYLYAGKGFNDINFKIRF